MNLLKTSPLRLIACLAALFLGATPMLAQDEDEYGPLFDSIPIPDGLNKEDLRTAIAPALIARGWTVKEQSDRRVIGYLKHRGNEATVTFILDGEQIQIFCVGWALNRQGQRAKPETPRGWLGNLRKDIAKSLNAKAAQRMAGE